MSSGAVRRRRSWLARQDWFFALALALFVGVAVWFGRAIQDFFQPSARALTVPTLVGQTLNDAMRGADRVRLHAAVVSREQSDQYPKDIVIRQEPAAGAQVREGRQISLVVSSGVTLFPMPDLRYEAQREVDLDLAHYKLLPGKIRTTESGEVPANRVVSQDPPPLSSVRVGSTVNLVYSKGNQARLKVPSFIGLSVEEARDIADRARIHFGQFVWTPFGRWGGPRGQIANQKPAAGTLIDPTDLVSLQVNAGPEEAGFIIRQVHATASVPDEPDYDGKAPVVRIAVRDETGEWNVYDAYAQPRQKLDFNLTVVGTSELDMYVNNELLSSTHLGVEPTPSPAKKRPL